MILIKTKREIELMREAGRILALTRQMLEPHIQPGISTHQLDLLAEAFIKSKNATPSFKGYHGFTGSICTSVNEQVIHGIPSKNKILKSGDILSLDLGVNYQGYHADSAWTYPVGTISKEVEVLLNVTKEALFKGINEVKPGAYVSDISKAVEACAIQHGYGVVEEFTGHGIGSSLHEEPYIPNYVGNEPDVMLKVGMTFCIEPMFNLGTKRIKVLKDNWTTVTTDKKYSAHFEHTVLVTPEGFEILTTLKE